MSRRSDSYKRNEQQLQARQRQQQRQQQFIAEFVRRLREAPDGTRVYMRCGDVFAPLAGTPTTPQTERDLTHGESDR
jgi:hypothetical protein